MNSKTSMNDTPIVNFINVLRARFSYKSYILAAFLVTFWLWRQNFIRKKCTKMLMKLTPNDFCPFQKFTKVVENFEVLFY